MGEENGITASRMYAERIMKVQIPIDDKIDWRKELEEFNRKYGRKLDPDEINRMLHERFGERRVKGIKRKSIRDAIRG